jgi:glutaredoxin
VGLLDGVRGTRRRPTVTVYTREGCGLCRKAEETVAVVAGRRADVVLVDIDAVPAITDRYTIRVPVVAVDGVEHFEHEVDPLELRRVLRAAARSAAAR